MKLGKQEVKGLMDFFKEGKEINSFDGWDAVESLYGGVNIVMMEEKHLQRSPFLNMLVIPHAPNPWKCKRWTQGAFQSKWAWLGIPL